MFSIDAGYLLGLLLVALIFGALSAWVLDARGHFAIGFLLGVLLGPVGLIISLIIRASGPPAPDPITAARSEAHVGERKCPECAEWVKAEAVKCRFCGAKLESPAETTRARSNEPPAPTPTRMATCTHCGRDVDAAATRCGHCMRKREPDFSAR